MDVKVAKEVRSITIGVPIFDIVAIILLVIISKLGIFPFGMPMIIGIILIFCAVNVVGFIADMVTAI